MLLKRKTAVSLILGILLGILFSSCRDDEKSGKKGKALEDHLIIEILLKVPEEDVLEIYYREANENYDSKKRVETIIKGSTELQKAVFVLDKMVFPTNIRVDLGKNENQGVIFLDNITLKYNEAEYIFDKNNIKKYFRPSIYLDFDFETMTGKPKKVDNKFDPYLDSNNISKFVNRIILY
jgi:hypothetical protein